MNLVCIYCKREKPKDQFNKEHVLLSAFGNFPTKNSSPQLKKEVCTKCNQFFGDGIDNFFARQSFEGLKRLEYGNDSEAKGLHKQVYFKMKSYNDDQKTPSPIFYMDRERKKLDIAYGICLFKKNNENIIADLFLDTRDPRSPTLTSIDPSTPFNHSEWIDSIERFEICCKGDTQRNLIQSILHDWGIEIDLSDEKLISAKSTHGPMKGNAEFIINAYINNDIYRAVSKILFNYATYILGANEVIRKEWDDCRSFIRFNDAKIEINIDTDPFWDSDPQNMRFEKNSIDLRFENFKGNIIGKICFYGYWTYNIVLAKNRTVKDNLLSGHYFINGCKPQNAFKIKKGLGIYVPTIGINEVGQYFKKYRKL